MALTPSEIIQFDRSIAGLRALLERNTRALWREAPDVSDPVALRDFFEAVFPAFLAEHGELASLLAVDLYDAVRDDDDYLADLVDEVPAADVRKAVGWSVTPAFSEEPDAAGTLRRLLTSADRLVTDQVFDTIVTNAQRDPRRGVRVARVPESGACAWCRVLSSRGAVYASEASALRASHAHCHCDPVPVFEGDALPYDRDTLYDEYRAATRNADGRGLKAITAQMRAESGGN